MRLNAKENMSNESIGVLPIFILYDRTSLPLYKPKCKKGKKYPTTNKSRIEGSRDIANKHFGSHSLVHAGGNQCVQNVENSNVKV